MYMLQLKAFTCWFFPITIMFLHSVNTICYHQYDAKISKCLTNLADDTIFEKKCDKKREVTLLTWSTLALQLLSRYCRCHQQQEHQRQQQQQQHVQTKTHHTDICSKTTHKRTVGIASGDSVQVTISIKTASGDSGKLRFQ